MDLGYDSSFLGLGHGIISLLALVPCKMALGPTAKVATAPYK